jgi:hypothetical protein
MILRGGMSRILGLSEASDRWLACNYLTDLGIHTSITEFTVLFWRNRIMLRELPYFSSVLRSPDLT